MSLNSPSSDRRNLSRRPVQVRVDFKAGNRVGRALTVDLSEGGVFLNTSEKVAPETTIYLRLYPGPGKPEIKLVGEVRRVVSPGEGPLPGLGIAFQSAFSEDRFFLRQFLTGELKQKVAESDIAAVEREPGSNAPQLSKYAFIPKPAPAQPGAKNAPAKPKPARKSVSDRDALKALEFEVPTHWLAKVPWKLIGLVGSIAVLYFLLSKVLDLLLAL